MSVEAKTMKLEPRAMIHEPLITDDRLISNLSSWFHLTIPLRALHFPLKLACSNLGLLAVSSCNKYPGHPKAAQKQLRNYIGIVGAFPRRRLHLAPRVME